MVAVGTKEELQRSDQPRIRQLLDRIPDPIADTTAIDVKGESQFPAGCKHGGHHKQYCRHLE
jgi:hypothetical protein